MISKDTEFLNFGLLSGFQLNIFFLKSCFLILEPNNKLFLKRFFFWKQFAILWTHKNNTILNLFKNLECRTYFKKANNLG
ncbi:hypothetical protein F1631_20540 [Leptospira interrogans serovar Yeoncheon]|nr:hypothetical protein [Leptospira interrogans serovar Yeoncheon]